MKEKILDVTPITDMCRKNVLYDCYQLCQDEGQVIQPDQWESTIRPDMNVHLFVGSIFPEEILPREPGEPRDFHFQTKSYRDPSSNAESSSARSARAATFEANKLFAEHVWPGPAPALRRAQTFGSHMPQFSVGLIPPLAKPTARPATVVEEPSIRESSTWKSPRHRDSRKRPPKETS
jgi:hypothetical protein